MQGVLAATPPSTTILSSSPSSFRGQSSIKRVVSARGGAGRVLSTSSGGTGTAESFEKRGSQELISKYSLSSSARKSSATSPRDGSTTPPKISPSCITVGFELSSKPPTPPPHQTCGNVVPFPSGGLISKSRSGKPGLLSRALTAEEVLPEVQSLPTLPETSAFPSFQHGSSAAFFPDVDLTLLKDAQERHRIFHSELVSTAYMIAAHAYEGQFRKDGTSLLSHCVMTALTLADLGLDTETVAAGLLHEVLRNNEVFRSQLEEFMPTSVVQLVDRATTIGEISQLYRNHRDTLNDEKLRRMLLAMEDVKAVLVKLACRVHNMKTISALPRDKQISLAQETLEIYAVVANRLGVWCLKAELEDLAFSVLHPDEYKSLRAQVEVRQDAGALASTVHKIKASLDAHGVKYEDISGRPKNLYGIWQKMRSNNISNLDQVYDLTALRVVVSNKHDCYQALRAVQSTYRCMATRSKDYIKVIRKANGYQSLHETIIGDGGLPVEVQIRTHKMHYIAEYGFAAHWKYKEKLSDEDAWLDKEVQYKKWLVQYKLGVHDARKVRPSGSPAADSALKSLGMHLLDADVASLAAGSSSPAESAHSKVDPFLRHDRFKLQQPSRQAVSVVVQTQDSIDAKEFPPGYTAGQVMVDLGVANLPGYALTVNQKLPSPDCMLRNGDLVQVVPMSQVLSRSPPDKQRALPSRGLDVYLPGVSHPITVGFDQAKMVYQPQPVPVSGQ